MKLFPLVLLGLGPSVVGNGVVAEEWPHWRGPTTASVSASTGVATSWGPAENVLWRAPLPGSAGASPVVAGGRVFVTAAAEEELVLLAFATQGGRELWRRTVSTGQATFRGDEGNLASPSPATDGKLVVSMMGDGVLGCYRVTGEPVWKVDLNERFGKLVIQFGYSSTPILHNGRVLLQWLHGEGDPATEEARVVALDLASGDTLWESPRVTGASQECEHSYASPVLVEVDGKTLLVTHGADAAVAYDTADGSEVWRVTGFNSPGNYHTTLRFVASPGVGRLTDGSPVVVVPTAKNEAVAVVRADGHGELAGTPSVLWRLDSGTPDVPSPLVVDGLVYLCGEDGNLAVHDLATGKRVYRKRTVADRHRASPLYADGNVYLTSRRGVVTVVRAGREFEVVAKNDLGEPMASSPAIADGVLYLRTDAALYAIGER
ncbi:MAG: PQQ-binding-like beta-propeller repeat protein [Lacipirellulaceae bacterium]